MATLVVYPSYDRGGHWSDNTWATVYNATSAEYVDPVGQTSLELGASYFAPTYYADQIGLAFDTSALGSGATVSGTVLALYGSADSSTIDFTMEVAAYDFGATYDAADWRSRSQLGSLTIACSRSSSGWTTAGYNDFTESGTVLSDALAKTGTTRLVVWPQALRTGTPTGSSFLDFWSADEDQSGERRPRLTITYTEAGVTGTMASSVAPSASSSGSPVVAGAAASSVAPSTSATGTPIVSGTMPAATAPATSATGTPVVTGTSAPSVSPSTAASGASTVTGAAASSVAPSTAASGSPVAAGTMASATAPSVATSGTPVVTATAASSVAPSTALLGEAQAITGTMASSVAPSTAASGTPRVTGAVSSSVAAVASATGSGIVTGTIATAIPAVMAAALGTMVSASGSELTVDIEGAVATLASTTQPAVALSAAPMPRVTGVA